MRLADKYLVTPLLRAVYADISESHIWSIVNYATECRMQVLRSRCWHLIFPKIDLLVNESDFLNATTEVLTHLTAFGAMKIEEMDLFKACHKWSEYECHRQGLEVNTANRRQVMDPFVKNFVFQDMTKDEFSGFPCECGILTGDEQDLIFRLINHERLPSPFRKYRFHREVP